MSLDLYGHGHDHSSPGQGQAAPAEPAGPVQTAASAREDGLVSLDAQPSAAPARINERGCQVFRDEAAKQKLTEWGYPWMGGSRYPFDEHLKGWEQFDTPQDASYYGVWTSVDRKATVSYTEGDVTLVVAPDEKSFKAEIRSMWDWNYGYKPDSGVHAQMDSPKLHAAALVGHPPFDQVLADYQRQRALEREYQGLHKLAYEKLVDPSLPAGRFRIHSTDENIYFLRGWIESPKDICVCKKEGYGLNRPDHVLTPWPGRDAEALSRQIELLKALLAS
jgi:hypothetical protein